MTVLCTQPIDDVKLQCHLNGDSEDDANLYNHI